MGSTQFPNIFKAYDIRGLVGTELTPDFSFATGAAFARFIIQEREPGTVIIGEDMRPSSPQLADAFSAGVTSHGLDVIRIGLASTDMLYFAAGKLNMPGAMFTASHNPAEYNGIKLCLSGARPIGKESGLLTIENFVRSGSPISFGNVGKESKRNLLAEYVKHLHTLVDVSDIRRLKIVIDAGNGMGGMTVPAVLGHASDLEPLPLQIIPMYFELDGTFPNHEANPLDPKNLVDLQQAVVEHGADIGLAFDGDADRCFVIDEQGQPVTPSAVAAIVARREIARERESNPGAPITVLHNLLTSKIVEEVIAKDGARPVKTKVGHSLIKDKMAETNAIFGGEHSAHYYFRDFWGADNGMLAAMHVLAEFGAQEKPLSEFAKKYNPYYLSGEINSTVSDVAAAKARVQAAFADRADFDEFDGITATNKQELGKPADAGNWWWFNVRASNTEPLLRLNVEASTEAKMTQIRDEVLNLIQQKA